MSIIVPWSKGVAHIWTNSTNYASKWKNASQTWIATHLLRHETHTLPTYVNSRSRIIYVGHIILASMTSVFLYILDLYISKRHTINQTSYFYPYILLSLSLFDAFLRLVSWTQKKIVFNVRWNSKGTHNWETKFLP